MRNGRYSPKLFILASKVGPRQPGFFPATISHFAMGKDFGLVRCHLHSLWVRDDVNYIKYDHI